MKPPQRKSSSVAGQITQPLMFLGFEPGDPRWAYEQLECVRDKVYVIVFWHFKGREFTTAAHSAFRLFPAWLQKPRKYDNWIFHHPDYCQPFDKRT